MTALSKKRGNQRDKQSPQNAIRIKGGKVLLHFEGKRTRRQNRNTYWLDLATNTWSSGR